jgi:dolichyl-diphosphooligosaccharide--protein glycosyltransferase
MFKDFHVLQILFPAGLILLAHGDCVEHCTGSDNDSGSASDSGNGSDSQSDSGHRRQRNSTRGRAPSDAKVFVALFGCAALYFNGIMERCSLIFAPVACVVSGIAINRAVGIYAATSLRACRRCASKSKCCGVGRIGLAQKGDCYQFLESTIVVEDKAFISNSGQRPVLIEFAAWLGSTGVVLSLLGLTCMFMQHAVWMAAVEFSSPSVIFAKPDGLSMYGNQSSAGDADAYVDDFREAYMWLRLNTPEDAKVLAWWDYGYQIAALANRTTFCDGNTWNHTAIAAVGRVLVSSEVEGARLMREMGADFVLIVFGGVVGWPNDDIGKMLWPIRIASEVFPDAVHEKDFLSGGAGGRLRMDSGATRAVKESLLVKCAYHRFELQQHSKKDSRSSGSMDTSHGYDRARVSYGPFGDAATGNRRSGSTHTKPQQQLRELREVYSTTNWVVRIFAVNRESNRLV